MVIHLEVLCHVDLAVILYAGQLLMEDAEFNEVSF